MANRCIVMLLLLSVAGTKALTAQQVLEWPIDGTGSLPIRLPTSHRLGLERTSSEALQLFPPAPDHRYEGAAIGLVTLGIAGALLGHGFCKYSEESRNCTGPAVGMSFLLGGIGALTGALIGGLIPKPTAEP
jgi:hypothetical protein